MWPGFLAGHLITVQLCEFTSSSVLFSCEPKREEKYGLNKLSYFGLCSTPFLRGDKKTSTLAFLLLQIWFRWLFVLQCWSKVLTITSQIFCAETLYRKFNMFEERLIKITTVSFGGTEMKDWLKNLSNISYNDDTWHSYILPKKDSKNIQITWHKPWVLLTTAFFTRNQQIFLYQEIQI